MSPSILSDGHSKFEIATTVQAKKLALVEDNRAGLLQQEKSVKVLDMASEEECEHEMPVEVE